MLIGWILIVAGFVGMFYFYFHAKSRKVFKKGEDPEDLPFADDLKAKLEKERTPELMKLARKKWYYSKNTLLAFGFFVVIIIGAILASLQR